MRPKLKVLLLHLTHSYPSPTEVCPRAPCLKEVGNLQRLLVFLHGQHKTAAENAHIKELKKYRGSILPIYIYIYIYCDSMGSTENAEIEALDAQKTVSKPNCAVRLP